VQLSCNVPCWVALDGKPLGATPIRLGELAPGNHQLSFTARSPHGIAVRDAVLSVGPGEATEVAMTFGTGTLSITSPSPATVYIVGKKRGRTPIRSLTLIEGTHEVLVVGPRLGKRKLSVTILPGKATALKVK
jgi:hypothetical protein